MFERIWKRLDRSMKVSWREQPTRHDVAAVKEHRDKMALVIRTRWQILAVLFAYVAGLVLLNRTTAPADEVVHGTVPLICLIVAVLLFNTLYQLTYRRLSNLAFLNWTQLVVDMVFVALLVYFTGGASSIIWPMMLLFIIEGAIIIGPFGAWGLALVGMALLSFIVVGEMWETVPRYTSPFTPPAFDKGSTAFVSLLVWQAAVLFGMALTSNSLARLLSRTARSARPNAVLDDETGLFSAGHFFKLVDIELARARRAETSAHLLVIDIDEFGEFNRRFGIDAGDEIIRKVADCLVAEVRHVGGIDGSSNLVARLAGEEFAILYSYSLDSTTSPDAEEAAVLAEKIRAHVARTFVDGVGVTVSIGIASMPDDGLELEQLRDEADAALAMAASGGGNRIQSAGAFLSEEDDDEYVPFTPRSV